jgi:hypothetical protein
MTQQVSAEGQAYHNFVKYMTNPYTSINYISRLKVFLKYCQTDNADNLLFNGNINMIQTRICDFLVHAQSQGFSSATITSYLTTIKFFYEMNDVTSLNWKKIARIKKPFRGEGDCLMVQEVSFLTLHDIISSAIDELMAEEIDEEGPAYDSSEYIDPGAAGADEEVIS